jgi:hypothetical protein
MITINVSSFVEIFPAFVQMSARKLGKVLPEYSFLWLCNPFNGQSI